MVSSNFTSTRARRTAWVANLHHRSSSYSRRVALRDHSRASASTCEVAPPRHRAYRSLAQVRGRPKSRRRRAGGALCIAGIEGVGLPSPTSTQTTTNSAVSVPQPGNTAPAAGGITKQKLPSGGDRKGQAATGSGPSITKTHVAGTNSSSNASKIPASSSGAAATKEGQQANAGVLEEDEGEAICHQLEGKICRDVKVAGDIFHFRVARLDEYLAVADVRFSVFSPVHATLKHRFRERSCTLMGERRRRGAFCLVAVLERLRGAAAAGSTTDGWGGHDDAKQGSAANGGRSSNSHNSGRSDGEDQKKGDDRMREVLEQQHVLGTLECSKHEFENTSLAEEGSVEGGMARYVFARVPRFTVANGSAAGFVLAALDLQYKWGRHCDWRSRKHAGLSQQRRVVLLKGETHRRILLRSSDWVRVLLKFCQRRLCVSNNFG